jgi:hypothetical protein
MPADYVFSPLRGKFPFDLLSSAPIGDEDVGVRYYVRQSFGERKILYESMRLQE